VRLAKDGADIVAHSAGFDGLWLNTAQEMSIRNEHAIADRYLFDGSGEDGRSDPPGAGE
jgi:Rieske 2Fe-2S family protein